MIDKSWYDQYMERYRCALFDTDVFTKLIELRDMCLSVREHDAKLMIAGNGASAAIASHAAADFTKQGNVRAMTFHDPDLITMMANDYGYESWLAQTVKAYQQKNDLLILISSSGSSANILNAAAYAKNIGLPVVGFCGFGKDRPLEKSSTLCFTLDSRAYNIIENSHSIWITTVIDMLVGDAEYAVN